MPAPDQPYSSLLPLLSRRTVLQASTAFGLGLQASTAFGFGSAIGLGSLPAAAETAHEVGSGAGVPVTNPDQAAAVLLLPTPREVTVRGDAVRLRGSVQIVRGREADDRSLNTLTHLLQQVRLAPRQVMGRAGKNTSGPRIVIGTAQDNPAMPEALAALGITGAERLGPEGYVVSVGNVGGPLIVLHGADHRGTFYALQTFRQLLGTDGSVHSVDVVDEPLMEIRGSIEGFYGIPWSHQARLDHFVFYGQHKLNTYIYTPKDDLLLRSRWRELYQEAELAQLRELVETANANHVEFIYALSPGNSITYSSEADYQSTIAKFDQIRALGVRTFYIALDDISWDLNPTDAAQFSSLAQAQAFYLNRIQREYLSAHSLPPLHTVPTDYAGSGQSAYKDAFGPNLDPAIRIQWTGEGVFSPSVTAESVQRAVANYHTEHLYIWDNFPVNDGMRHRLFLNPLEGRDLTLHNYLAGFTANPMIEPYASLIALAGYGDYCWNPPAYDAQQSQQAIITELAGADSTVREHLAVFVDLNQNWPYRGGSPTAPELSSDVTQYWAALDSGDEAGRTALRQRISAIAALTDSLAGMTYRQFYDDVLPWVVAADHWGNALLAFDRMLTALSQGRHEDASAEAATAKAEIALTDRATVPNAGEDGVRHENQIVPTVGDGTFNQFALQAWERLRAVLPQDPSLPFRGLPGTASSTMAHYSNHVPALMLDGDFTTMYWSNRAPQIGDTITVELAESHPISFVRISMSTSDGSNGDQIYAGDIELSADGQTWVGVGTTNAGPVAETTLTSPITARWARIRVTAENPGNKWVQVREFAVAERAPQ